ncbi:MAG: tetratricopeptide repeat protein, partial [Chloroflexota bacterium]
AARGQSNQFTDGTFFVSLQALNSSEFVMTAIAEALDFQFADNQPPQQQLVDYLSKKSCLLVLDNFEHLLDAASLIDQITQRAPHVKSLITSRERLNLLEEWVLEISGLAFPTNEAESSIERYDAVALFVQHAERVHSSFLLAEKRIPAVIRICRLVEGMPLGIELAAAWVRVLPCEQIANEIERSLDILETPARNVPPRHRNIRAVFSPTWERLSAVERNVFMKLSVFRGGFTLDAATQVAEASLQTLSALVDQSLLRIDANERYIIHELLRQFGEEQIVLSGKFDSIRDLHSLYYADFCSQREQDIKGRRQIEALDELEADFENVRTAWLWAVEQRLSHSIDHILESLFLYCEMRSRFYEGDELFQQAQSRFAPDIGEAPSSVWGKLLARIVFGRWDDQEVRRERREQALAIALRFDSQEEIGYCFWRLGEFSVSSGNFSNALSFLKQSHAYYREVEDRFYIAKVLNEFGIAYRQMGQLETALDFEQQSLTLRRAIGDQRGIGSCLYDMGKSFYIMGRYAQAQRNLQEAVSLWRKLNDRFGIRSANEILGYLALLSGDFEQAKILSEECLALATDLGVQRDHAASSLTNLGVLACLQEDYVRGQQLCQQSLEMTPSGDLRAYIHWGLAVAACGLEDYQVAKQFVLEIFNKISTYNVDSLLTALPVVAIILAHERQSIGAVELLGFAFTYPDNLTDWLEKWSLFARVRSELEVQLGADAYRATWDRGTSFHLEDVAALVLERFQPELQPQLGAHQASNHSLVDPLSERELEVLKLLMVRQTNREIADALYISVGTVKTHVHHIMNKLNVTSRREITARAAELHLPK